MGGQNLSHWTTREVPILALQWTNIYLSHFLLPLNTTAFLVMKVEPVAIKCVSTIFLATSVVGSGKYLISILLVLVWPLSCAVSPVGLKQLHSTCVFVCFHYL